MRGFISLGVLFFAGTTVSAADVILNPGRHTDSDAAPLVSPDGKTIITLGNDRCARVWDIDARKQIRELWLPPGTGAANGSTTFKMWLSRDGKMLAAPFHTHEEPRGKLILIPLDDSGTYRVIGGNIFAVDHVAFSQDGKRVATACKWPPVIVWDVATGKQVCEIKHDGDMRAAGLAFTPDGDKLTVALPMVNFNEKKHSGISTFDATTGKFLSEIVQKEVGRPEWSPDGKLLAIHRGTIDLFTADGTLKKTIPAKFGNIFAAGFDQKGRFLTASSDDVLRAGRVLTLGIHDAIANNGVSGISLRLPADQFAISADGGRVIASGTGTLTAYDLATGKLIGGVQVGEMIPSALGWASPSVLAWGVSQRRDGEETPLTKAVDVADAKLAAVFDAKVTRRRTEWDGVTLHAMQTSASAARSGKEVKFDYTTEFDWEYIKTSTLVGPGHAVLATSTGLFGYDTKTGKQVCTYSPSGGAIAVSPDGQFFAATSFADPLIRVYRPGKSEPVLTLYTAGNEWIAWTADGSWASSAKGDKLAGSLSKQEPGKLRTFVPFAEAKRNVEAVKKVLSRDP